jgi:hypothetical protein
MERDDPGCPPRRSAIGCRRTGGRSSCDGRRRWRRLRQNLTRLAAAEDEKIRDTARTLDALIDLLR